MSDDILIREWQMTPCDVGRPVHETVAAALARDRSECARERTTHLLSAGGAAVLWPILLWAAAHGVTPVVRGGYALIAVGIGIMLFSELAYVSWNRRARPGPIDAITQLREAIGRAPVASRTGVVGGRVGLADLRRHRPHRLVDLHRA